MIFAYAGAASADPYFNSAEPGCDGSDPNVLMCDDFEDGDWFFDGDASMPENDGWNRMSTGDESPAGAAICGNAGAVGSSCAALRTLHVGTFATAVVEPGDTVVQVDSTATLPDSGSAMLADSDGCQQSVPGTCQLFSWTGKTATTLTGFDGAALDRSYGVIGPAVIGYEGGSNMADHALSSHPAGEDEIFVRYYYKADPGYVFGAEKGLTINDGNPGDGGIKWGNLSFNCGGQVSQSGSMRVGYEGICEDVNWDVDPGTWYFLELHIKLDTVGADDGVFELWAEDCGADGLACSGEPTLRFSRMDVNWGRTSADEKITVLWFEDWANPASVGTSYLDQIKVTRVGPIGFAGETSNPSGAGGASAASGAGGNTASGGPAGPGAGGHYVTDPADAQGCACSIPGDRSARVPWFAMLATLLVPLRRYPSPRREKR
jgi:hypothetical protein